MQNRLPRCRIGCRGAPVKTAATPSAAQVKLICRHAQRRPSQVNLPPRPRLPQAEAEVLEDAPERAEGVKVKAEADAEVQARG